MATILKFEDIEAWQKARVLAKEIFTLSNETALNKGFRFRDQINAAVGSIMDNIAEGFERGGKLEFINFLTIAKGSSAEVRSQLYRVYDRSYMPEEKLAELKKNIRRYWKHVRYMDQIFKPIRTQRNQV